jgi:tetratricopeptide (TPR) repeat protein
MLGAIYQNLDMRDEAIEQYSIAIDLDKEQLHAYVNRGEMLLQNGQIDLALKDLDRATELDKDGAETAGARAHALAKAARTVAEGMKKVFGTSDLSTLLPKK